MTESLGSKLLQEAHVGTLRLPVSDVGVQLYDEVRPLLKGYPSTLAALARASLERSVFERAPLLVELSVDPAWLAGLGLNQDLAAEEDGSLRFALEHAYQQRCASLEAANDPHTRTEFVRALSAFVAGWKLDHSVLVAAVADLLGHCQHIAEVREVLTDAALVQKSAYDRWAALTEGELVQKIVSLLVAHGSEFAVGAGPGGTRIQIARCATGGALLADTRPRGPLEKRDEWFPYCVHCSVWNAELPRQWYGRVLFEVQPSASEAERCELVFSRAGCHE